MDESTGYFHPQLLPFITVEGLSPCVLLVLVKARQIILHHEWKKFVRLLPYTRREGGGCVSIKRGSDYSADVAMSALAIFGLNDHFT